MRNGCASASIFTHIVRKRIFIVLFNCFRWSVLHRKKTTHLRTQWWVTGSVRHFDSYSALVLLYLYLIVYFNESKYVNRFYATSYNRRSWKLANDFYAICPLPNFVVCLSSFQPKKNTWSFIFPSSNQSIKILAFD